MEPGSGQPEADDGLLTRIHGKYTLSTLQETGDPDSLMVREFLHTLAEVALAVASRMVKQ